MDEIMKIQENIESSYALTIETKPTESSCYFTTGFFKGFFLAVKNQHISARDKMLIGDVPQS